MNASKLLGMFALGLATMFLINWLAGQSQGQTWNQAYYLGKTHGLELGKARFQKDWNQMAADCMFFDYEADPNKRGK